MSVFCTVPLAPCPFCLVILHQCLVQYLAYSRHSVNITVQLNELCLQRRVLLCLVALFPLQVRVDVHFCGINFADILACHGQYQERHQLPFTPGEYERAK